MSVNIGSNNRLGTALVGFSRDGAFPDHEDIVSAYVQDDELPDALAVLKTARSELEAEIRTISQESAPEVDTWITNAKALQEDIYRARTLASEIIRQAEESDAAQKALRDAHDHVEFLKGEAQYTDQLKQTLLRTKEVKDILDNAERRGVERKTLEALHLLSNAWDIIYSTSSYGRTRALRLLDDRAFALKTSLHQEFSAIWAAMVHVDEANRSITIQSNATDPTMPFDDAVTVMQAYNELDTRIGQLKNEIMVTIIKPRIDLKASNIPAIIIDEKSLRLSDIQADRTITSVFDDIVQIILYFSSRLPQEFARSLSDVLMPELCTELKDTWLDSAVPASLDDMTAFREALAAVEAFLSRLVELGWAGTDDLQDWIANAPRIWLSKRRETSLDWSRNQLALGVGIPKRVDRVETQTISQIEERQIGASSSDWDAAWSDDESKGHEKGETNGSEVDDAGDSWGWGDEDDQDELANVKPREQALPAVRRQPQPATRQVTLTEKYAISSMPEPVLRTITLIVEDAAVLTKPEEEENPVTSAAGGLFALPTLVLAMYRAVSPHYYNLAAGGQMYQYNDAMWLAEQLLDFSKRWQSREDLTVRAQGRVKFDADVTVLEKFARRAYGNEMTTQRTILNDLLGGAQSFLQQDGQGDDEASIDSAVALVRTTSARWKTILSKSAWAQAVGNLLSTIAKKIILDIQDTSALGADEAFRVANLIAKVVKLDDLFVPDDPNQPQVPLTSQYAPNWLKLNFLSEVLQSDLKDVRYLWFESDLSLYFTPQEVIDLIELSFENSYRSREVIAAIRENRHPRTGDGG